MKLSDDMANGRLHEPTHVTIIHSDHGFRDWVERARELEAQVSQLQRAFETEAYEHDATKNLAAAQLDASIAQVSQLTAERDEVLTQRDVARGLVRLTYAKWSPELADACKKSVDKWDAEPAWRADSAHLGVTEAEVLKDLEKR